MKELLTFLSPHSPRCFFFCSTDTLCPGSLQLEDLRAAIRAIPEKAIPAPLSFFPPPSLRAPFEFTPPDIFSLQRNVPLVLSAPLHFFPLVTFSHPNTVTFQGPHPPAPVSCAHSLIAPVTSLPAAFLRRYRFPASPSIRVAAGVESPRPSLFLFCRAPCVSGDLPPI